MWTLSILTALTLMFFLLNYANILKAEVRAQNAADTMAVVILNTQATRWNKLSMALYAADVEEWRIRSLIEGMINAVNLNGGCGTTARCMAIYQALQPQYYKAVNRYTADLEAIDSFSWYAQGNINGSSFAWGLYALYNQQIPGDNNACSQNESSYCSFSFQLLNFGQRATTAQVGRDAIYAHVGGTYSTAYFSNVAPNSLWQPLETEVASCETIQPLVNFSIFGQSPQPVQVIGRAAATMVPVSSEWLAPGVTVNPASGTGAVFQPTENYSATYDTFDASASPRDWYETTYPAQPYTAVPATPDFTIVGSTLTPDFEVYASWWGVMPIAPYTQTNLSSANLCTGFY
jgi:hypothetical protein